MALIPQTDMDRPGVVACELGLAPENLDEYRTRIDGNAKRGGRPGATLAKNEVVKGPKGESRLESLWEFRPKPGGLWRELSVRVIANRQMYTFMLNTDDATYPPAQPAFDALLDSATFSPPNTGADRLAPSRTAGSSASSSSPLDLPDGWQPVLAPSQVALFFANGPPHGIWSDNLLVLAQPHRQLDLRGPGTRRFPTSSARKSRTARSSRARSSSKGRASALETVVRTQPRPVLDDRPRTPVPRRPVRLRGQVHRRVEPLRRA